ncbi:MAG: class I SAM-dependent methyltransferase, partial [Bacteroidia bacterium]
MKTQLHYLFETVTHCEMCNDATSTHKVLGQRLNTSQGLSPKKQTGISVSVMQCTKCNLIYASPQPIPYDIQQHYGVPPEEYWRSVYFNEEQNVFKKEIDIVKNKLPFTNGMKALDIGAGLGKVMNALTQHGFDVYGLEPSVPFYERAISLSKIATDKLKLGMVENVTYPKNTFDFITYGAVFEHLYHPAHSLEKSLEWLKPNGIVHIEVPSSNHFIAKLVNFYYKLRGT